MPTNPKAPVPNVARYIAPTAAVINKTSDKAPMNIVNANVLCIAFSTFDILDKISTTGYINAINAARPTIPSKAFPDKPPILSNTNIIPIIETANNAIAAAPDNAPCGSNFDTNDTMIAKALITPIINNKLGSNCLTAPMRLQDLIIKAKQLINMPSAIVGPANLSGLINDNNPTANASTPIAATSGHKVFPRSLASPVDLTTPLTNSINRPTAIKPLIKLPVFNKPSNAVDKANTPNIAAILRSVVPTLPISLAFKS